MYPKRAIVFLLFILVLSCGSVFAQRAGPQFRRPLACEPLEPRTKLEAIEGQYERVVIKGFTHVAAFNARGGDVRVDAIELKEVGSATRALGIVVVVREPGVGERPPHDNRSFVDYDEIESLVKAIESIGRTNETVTKLIGFEARYRTPGDLDLIVFRQSRSGTAASLTSGICEKTTVLLTLDELDRLKGIIVEAKTRLDEIR